MPIAKSDLEKFREIYARLPVAEQKMPIVKIGGKIWTWEESYKEIVRGTKEAEEIVKRLHEVGVL